jgi:membrane protein implicated in regulation of membrane protease activity
MECQYFDQLKLSWNELSNAFSLSLKLAFILFSWGSIFNLLWVWELLHRRLEQTQAFLGFSFRKG